MRKDGVDFFLNTVDWLTLGDALIGIRSQTITNRPLQIKTRDGEFRDPSEIEKNLIKYLCIVGIPLLVVIFGLLRYFLKRRAKRFVGNLRICLTRLLQFPYRGIKIDTFGQQSS